MIVPLYWQHIILNPYHLSNIHTNHLEIYKAFRITEENRDFKARALANYLIDQIIVGNIPVDSKLPSVKDLRTYTKVSLANVGKALHIMQDKGYLLIVSGVLSIAKMSDTGESSALNNFYADFHIKQPRLHVLKLESHFQKLKIDCGRVLHPRMENSISLALIDTLANRFNARNDLDHNANQFCYTHNYQLLIKAVGLVIKEKPGVIVISAHSDSALRMGLASTGLKVLEVNTDKDGFCVDELAEICLNEKDVAAVFITSKACFPNFAYTTAARIKALFVLQAKHGFKIVENDNYSPWIADHNNLVLQMAGKAMDDVIYLYPISYLLYDISLITVVSANAEIVARITDKVIPEGQQKSRSIADATNELLQDKIFFEVEDMVMSEVSLFRVLILEVFMESGFWQLNNKGDDSGPGLFLQPKKGSFPTDAFIKLSKKGLVVYDPKKAYDGSSRDGLRFDLSFYISKKNFKADLQKIEKQCRNICLLAAGVEPIKI